MREHSRLFRLQSAHVLLHSSFSRFLITCWFCAARSGVGRRDMTERTMPGAEKNCAVEGLRPGGVGDVADVAVVRSKLR